MKFEDAVKIVLMREGGYVNHPQDPGGETNFGITAAVARENGYTGPMKEIPLEKVKQIYKAKYWDRCKCDDLPAPARLAVFDAAVNSGVSASVKFLQAALGVTVDGLLGPATLEKASKVDGFALAVKCSTARITFLTNLPTFATFGKGWVRRVAENLNEVYK